MESVHNPPQIEALLKGDEKVIRLLYDNVFPKVVSFVRGNRGNYSDAEEVFHNALYQLMARARARGVEIKSSFEAYVFTIGKNLWLKELNKRKKEVRNDGLFELKAKEDDSLVESILFQERWELLEEMILKLSKNCSELLKQYFNKVPYSVIVKKFSYATENTAFQRVFKCKKRLMDLVKADPRFKNLSEL